LDLPPERVREIELYVERRLAEDAAWVAG